MIKLSDTLISDLYKDARGYRPRYLPEYMEEGEFEALWSGLIEELTESMEAERASALRCQRIYEERISRYMAEYGIDRLTAIRWESEAEGDDLDPYDFGYWIYQRGMSYDLTDTYKAEYQAAGII